MTDHQVKEKEITETEEQIAYPKFYRVLFHNDNKTTMEFVIMVLVNIFHKSGPEAQDIMYTVHEDGIGLVGIYPFEIAEQKTDETLRLARSYAYPLAVTFEPEE
jgi:ATP-dependent Clp protease adaptor protein ClpS